MWNCGIGVQVTPAAGLQGLADRCRGAWLEDDEGLADGRKAGAHQHGRSLRRPHLKTQHHERQRSPKTWTERSARHAHRSGMIPWASSPSLGDVISTNTVPLRSRCCQPPLQRCCRGTDDCQHAPGHVRAMFELRADQPCRLGMPAQSWPLPWPLRRGLPVMRQANARHQGPSSG